MSARTDLRQAIKYGITQITTAAGYHYNFVRVYDPPISAERMFEYPSVNIYWGDERRLTDRTFGNNPLLDLHMSIMLSVFLKADDDPSTAVDNVLADVQKYFGNYYYNPSSEGDRTVFNMMYSSSSPWGVGANDPNFGIDIEFDVWYTIKLADPDSML